MAEPQASYLINQQIAALNVWAEYSLGLATEAMDALAQVEYEVIEIEGSDIEAFEPYEFTTPVFPDPLDVPSPPNLEAMTIPTAPVEPSVTEPSAPSLITITPPATPSHTTPTLTKPTAPTLPVITLPQLPVIDIPGFSVAPPDPIELTPPEWTFNVSTDMIISKDPMVAAAMNRLKANIESGGTGLSEAVETAIWDRDRERMEQQLSDSTDKVTSMWAKKGFSLPDGLLAHSLSELQKEYMNKNIDRSREIAVKQAELEQSNVFKSLELGVNLSFKLIQTLIQYAELVFRTEDATAKYFNEFLRLQIEAHNSVIEVFKARVQQYEAEVRAGMAKADLYKAQIEGQMALAGLGEAQIKAYTAEISAAISEYKGQLEGNQLISQLFGTQMQGVLAQANVNESMVRSYAEQVKAQSLRVDLYRGKVEAMAASINAEKIKIEANANQINSWAKNVDALIANQNLNIESIKSEAQLNMNITELSNKTAETAIRLRIAEEQLYLNNAQIQSTALIAKGNAMVEAARGAAQGAVSLAAGAMAAISAHSSMGYSESMAVTET